MNPEAPQREISSQKNLAEAWMVGLFDVLGFSNRLKSDGAENIYHIYKTLIKRIKEKNAMRGLGEFRFPKESTCYPSLFFADVQFSYFSDTLLLWLPLKQMLPAPFVQRCADLMCEALIMGIPLRGAIAIGDGIMCKDEGIYIGEMIVEAAKLEAAQNWVGAAFSKSTGWPKFAGSLSPSQIIEYEVPIKRDKEAPLSPIVLDWPRRWRETQTASLEKVLKELSPGEPYSSYYEEAISFAHWSEAHHDWHKHPELQSDFKFLKMCPASEVFK